MLPITSQNSRIGAKRRGTSTPDISNPKRVVPPSAIQSRLREKLSPVLGQLRENFKATKAEGESSLQKDSDDSHIIFYTGFLNYSLTVENYTVYPKDWAHAFLQTDYKSCAIKVCDIILKRAEGVSVHNDSRGLIHRIVEWMMSKFDSSKHIDPWSFPKITDGMPLPSGENYETVEEVVNNFCHTNNVEHEDAQVQNIINSVVSSVNWEDDLSNLIADLLEGADEIDDGVPLNGILNSPSQEPNRYDLVFTACMDYVSQLIIAGDNQSGDRIPTNSARLTAALTRETIPWNTDYFVDAVQFERERVVAASKEVKIETVAARLSKTLLRLNPVLSADKMCPVHLLAILRMAKHIQEIQPQLKCLSNTKQDKEKRHDILEFNSENPIHNRFPTLDEMKKIIKEINLTAASLILRLKLNPQVPGVKQSEVSSSVSHQSKSPTTEHNFDDMEPQPNNSFHDFSNLVTGSSATKTWDRINSEVRQIDISGSDSIHVSDHLVRNNVITATPKTMCQQLKKNGVVIDFAGTEAFGIRNEVLEGAKRFILAMQNKMQKKSATVEEASMQSLRHTGYWLLEKFFTEKEIKEDRRNPEKGKRLLLTLRYVHETVKESLIFEDGISQKSYRVLSVAENEMLKKWILIERFNQLKRGHIQFGKLRNAI